MADTHHEPSPGGFQTHRIAATIVGFTLLTYAVVMIGQALGLYTL